MRILLVSEATSEMLGGVTTEVRRLINGLRGRGHRLALASEAPVSGADADHFRLDMPRREATLQQLRQSISDFKPDIVHVVFAFSGGALFFARELRRHPWVLTCHSVPPAEWTLRRLHGHERLHYFVRAIRVWPETWLATRLYATRVPPRVIVHSDFMKRVVAGRLYPARRVDVIPFGFDPPDPPWPSGRLAMGAAPRGWPGRGAVLQPLASTAIPDRPRRQECRWCGRASTRCSRSRSPRPSPRAEARPGNDE